MDSGFFVKLSLQILVVSWTWILWALFQSPGFRISQKKYVDSSFHKQNFPALRNPDTLSWGNIGLTHKLLFVRELIHIDYFSVPFLACDVFRFKKLHRHQLTEVRLEVIEIVCLRLACLSLLKENLRSFARPRILWIEPSLPAPCSETSLAKRSDERQPALFVGYRKSLYR